MAVTPNLSSTLGIYLTQWLKIASGERVVLNHKYYNFKQEEFLVFSCKKCKDNWHVGLENFKSENAAIGIPSVLTDWVAKHRHVCTKYQGAASTGYLENSSCLTCQWPYKAHEQSWMAEVEKNQEQPAKPKSFWVGPQGHKDACAYKTTVATGSSTQNCTCGWVDYCTKNFQDAKLKIQMQMELLQAKMDAMAEPLNPLKPFTIQENVGRKFRDE